MTFTQTTRVLLLCCSLVAVGCGAPPEDIDEDTASLAVSTGVDYSWAHPSPASLHAAGYRFAVRYLSYDTTGKNLSRSEADALWNAGVDVVANWEWGGYDVLGGYARGASDARAAESQAVADGIPPGRPIYFSIDFDAQPNQQAVINAYFDGVASVIGRQRTGAYGGYYVIQRLFNAGKIAWGWQTYAWSYGQWDSRAQLRQVLNGVSVGGSVGCCDKDVAVAADYGQWHAGPAVGSDGCTAIEDANAAKFGCQCVDHVGSGGFCPGTGCTAIETANAAKFGCQCVDHKGSGGFCPGTGCTAKETADAAKFGCQCVDHQGSGGFCPGTGCTAKETADAAKFGCGCVDHKGAGGFCPGTGCTAHETLDCQSKGQKCSLHACVP